MMRTLCSTLLLSLSLNICAQIDSLRKYYKLGISAYETQDYSGFLLNMQRADGFRAFYPPIIYNIGAGYALAGNAEKATEYLKTYLTINSQVDFAADTDFAAIKDSEAFSSAVKLAAELSERITASQHYKQIEDVRHIEAIGVDESTGAIYLGDVWARQVCRYEDGKLSVLFDYAEQPELYSVMGIDVDEKNNKLWICSAALPQTQGYTAALEGTSSVFSYDLKTQSVQHHGTLTASNTFGDLIVSRSGKVYISDGSSNKVYTVDESGNLLVFADLSTKTLNLQGLTFDGPEKNIFVADYILGIFKLNLETRELTKVEFATDIPFKGIDGLYYHKNALFAIQNGTKPIRVTQLFLNKEETTVGNYAAFDQNTKYLNEPTQGFIYKRIMVYIANSPWADYNDQNEFVGTSDLLLRKIMIK
ncbi:MAG: hypothetical protein ABJH57_11720 [Cyclobacteriaceae bacterium]